MGNPAKVLLDQESTTLAAGVATEVFSSSGLDIADFASLSILVENTGANSVTDVAFYWSNDPGGRRWSARDKTVPAVPIVAADSTLYGWGTRKNCRVRMVVTSTAGSTIRVTVSARQEPTGDGTTINGVIVTSGDITAAGADGVSNTRNSLGTDSWISGFNGTTWDRLRAGLTTLSATFTGLLNSLPWAIYNATPTTRTEGQGGPLQADSLGSLNTTLATLLAGEDTTNGVMGVLPKPVVSSTYSWTRYQNIGATSGVTTANVKASAGMLFSIYCHNSNAAARYIQIHNTTTTPAGAAVPVLSFLVPAGGAVFIDSAMLGADGNYFSTGIAFAFSTTEGTYTAGAAADQYTQIMYA